MLLGAMASTKKTKGGGKVRRFTAAVTREEDMYVAQCLEVDVASQGETVEKALANLREALELYFEDEDAAAVPSSPIIAPIEVTLPG